MTTLEHPTAAPPMALAARTAADLMTPNPVSIGRGATVAETAAFLAARGISAAPVIDDAGRPVGVVSRTDLLVREAHRAARLAATVRYERLTVREVMTPVVFCVRPDTPAAQVVEKLLGLRVRRLFVVDDDGVLVGVVSAVDVLRKLRRGADGGAGYAAP